MTEPIIINGVSVPRPARLPLVVGDRVRLRDGYTAKINEDDRSGVPWFMRLQNGKKYWKTASGISLNSETDIMEILTPKPNYPMPSQTASPQPGEVWTMEVEVTSNDGRWCDVNVPGNGLHTVETRHLKSRVRAAAPKVEVRPGMLIRGLRGDQGVDVVMRVSGRELEVCTADAESAMMAFQGLAPEAEVRWPWEPESAWRRVTL